MIIHDGVRKKERIIEKPRFFPDQCIHWALMLQLQPILLKGMYDYCCASVPGKGLHYMKNHIENILVRDRKFTKYILIIDIMKFYDSIDLDILKKKLCRKIKDKKALRLIFLILSNREKGLPIGFFTSQWLANFFLQDFDHWIKEEKKVKHYFRYMDDCAFFSNNKKKLHQLRKDIEEYLATINLKIKPNWKVMKVEVFTFCGFKFHRGYTVLKSSNAIRIKRRINRISKKRILLPKDASAVISYWGFLSNTNSGKFINKNVKSKIKLKKCKEVISNASRKQYKTF